VFFEKASVALGGIGERRANHMEQEKSSSDELSFWTVSR
jgi:hypothetical protein